MTTPAATPPMSSRLVTPVPPGEEGGGGGGDVEGEEVGGVTGAGADVEGWAGLPATGEVGRVGFPVGGVGGGVTCVDPDGGGGGREPSALVTVSFVVAVTVPSVAVMVDVPAVRPLARPGLASPAVRMAAIAASLLDQVT
jgi:hypothetical protein